MMKHQRNTNGLKGHAQQKRDLAVKKTEEGLRKLLKEGRAINFESVAEAAEVSRAWLYNQPEIRARIEHLRSQQQSKKAVPVSQRASELSNAALVKTLREQVKKLQAEHQGLRQQLEVVHGRAVYADEQAERYRKEAEKLQAENAQLKQQLSSSNQHEASKETEIEVELNRLGVAINPTLAKVIRAASKETVVAAIEALKEAMVSSTIERPGGWLKRAIEEGWKPNDSYAQKVDLKMFNEWFSQAKAAGVVMASTQNDGQILVLTPNERWIPFAEMLERYPLSSLA